MKCSVVWRLPYLGTADVEAAARHVRVLTNRERARAGLSPLQSNARLDRVAAWHTGNMVARRFFDHVDPEGRTPLDRARLVAPELLLGSVGENLAMVPADPAPVVGRTLIEGWMDSPGHRANILEPGFSHLGVAVERDGRHILAAQVFGLLALEMLAPSPVLGLTAGDDHRLVFASLGGWDPADLMVGAGIDDAAWVDLGFRWLGGVGEASFRPHRAGIWRIVAAPRSTRRRFAGEALVRVNGKIGAEGS